ncbi:splicing factor U2af small subunit A-like [Hibiscus syriacus]|uniref:Splicing factor U2af small subunit A-like n=1 Tax=Hibiscus syriacus TaxID=106335 RepID=A0A6A2YQW9_HIBSY|nr:splicing factor U2af small subunit A-like [Hibiscus syriacus]
MSHGCVESTRDTGKGEDEPCSSLGRPKADDFVRLVSKIVVAQICDSVGFQGCKESALDALADILIRHLCDLGKNASFHANLAGRTECNAFDITRALEGFGDSHGFPGDSEIWNCLVGSGTVKEVVQFVDTKEEIPFSQPVPKFPVVRNRKLIPSFEHMNETPSGKHIPNWASDPCADKIEQARQRRKAKRALLRLQQRLVCNGSTGTSASMVLDAKTENIQEAGSNPFLAAPLQPGEKDVSEVSLSVKLSNEVSKGDHVSLLGAFVPVIEAMKNGLSERDGEKTIVPEKRPAVQFKFKTGKKILGESLDLSLQEKGERSASFFLRDDEGQ